MCKLGLLDVAEKQWTLPLEVLCQSSLIKV
jgi:hypothetical protein